jgi:hypothetical protein
MFFPLLPVSRHRHCYDRFPANIRTPAQDEKRRATLAAAATISPSFSRSDRGEHSKERAAERDLMVLDIKVKLQGLWKRLINLSGAEDPLSSSEYGTIFALIESDVEGIGGSGLVECLREHIQSVSMNYSWEPLVVLCASLFLLQKTVCMCVGLAMRFNRPAVYGCQRTDENNNK